MYNIMSCTGEGWSNAIFGDCSMAWISLILILFLAMILRRQCQDGLFAGTGFNAIGAFANGIFLNVLAISMWGSARWSLLAGIIGIAIGGFVIGRFFDTSSEYG